MVRRDYLKRRIKLTIEYLGGAYCGWQRQKNGIAVQEVIEGALFRLFSKNIRLQGAGRTDSGVHAAGQVAHFDVESSIPCEKIPFALNAFLPDDIQIIGAEEADENFNARFSAKSKIYRYALYCDTHIRPLLETQASCVHKAPDTALMGAAAEKLVGTHDFKCFLASGSNVKDTVRTIYSINVESAGKMIYITVSGNGFLYNMVRIIAGTLYYVGIGKLKTEDIERMLASGDRKLAGKTLPAKGLTLISVSY